VVQHVITDEEMLGQKAVVVVAKEQGIAMGQSGTSVASRAGAQAAMMSHQADMGAAMGELADDGGGAIAGSVIDHQDLGLKRARWVVSVQEGDGAFDTFEGRQDLVGAIVNGNDYREGLDHRLNG
jgi:hypothetical protein